jgi:predicted nucleic acid-binding protein
VLVDTSILVRALQPQHPPCGVAKNAIDHLRLKDRRLYVVPQNLVELWVVATRPVGENGLGMSFAEALAELARVKSFFALLPETEEIFLRGNAW